MLVATGWPVAVTDGRQGGPLLPGVSEVSEHTQQLIDEEVRRIVEEAERQTVALLEGDLWRRSAAHANAMAARLAAALVDVPGVRVTQPVQANAVFAVIPRSATAELQRDWHFYTWDEGTGEVHWMCSWDTTAEEVDAFAAAVARACRAAAPPT